MISNNSTDLIEILPEEEGVRLDILLSNRYKDFSRAYFQKLIENKLITINGKLVKKRYLVNAKDEIEIKFSDNGIGISEDFDINSSNTLGIKLIFLYAKQLNAKFEFKTKGGVSFQMLFKDNVYSERV